MRRRVAAIFCQCLDPKITWQSRIRQSGNVDSNNQTDPFGSDVTAKTTQLSNRAVILAHCPF